MPNRSPTYDITPGSSSRYYSSDRRRNLKRKRTRHRPYHRNQSSSSRSPSIIRTIKKHIRSRSPKDTGKKHRSKSKSAGKEVECDDHLDIKKILRYDDTDGHRKKYDKPTLGGWRIYDLLGKGTFGQVYRVYRKKHNEHQDAALKIIKNVRKYRHAGMIEVNTLSKVRQLDPEGRHSLCVLMLDWFEYHGHVCIAFELLGQSVYDFLKKDDYAPYPLDDTRDILYQLTQAVEFLHRSKIIHTDLKPENILFVDSSSVDWFNPLTNKYQRRVKRTDIRLIDFGSATSENEHHSTVVVTRHYRPPEVILQLGWSYPCDVWSVGCIAFELHTGRALFQTHSSIEHLEMMTRIFNAPLPRSMTAISPRQDIIREMDPDTLRIRRMDSYFNKENHQENKLYKWIEYLLVYNPEMRPTMRQAFRHSYFDGMEDFRPQKQRKHSISH